MGLYNSNIYIKDLKNTVLDVVNFEKLYKKSVIVTGATGLIGSFIVDILLMANRILEANITVYALGRGKERLKERFEGFESDILQFVEYDMNDNICFDIDADYIIHAAGNAYPAAFNADPTGTILNNIIGTQHLLEYAKRRAVKRFLYISSGEIYGQGDIMLDSYGEDYGGYMDSMQPRSCYPISKKAAETLCVSYTKQFHLDTVVVRPCHTFGPNYSTKDNRANVQFMNNVLKGEDIVLKSEGKQLRSYCYIADCVSAILTVLLNGKCGEAYNIARSDERVTIAEFAGIVAEKTGHKIIFEIPNKLALEEQTPIKKQVLNSCKLEELGWKGRYIIEEGIEHTLKILDGE